MNAKSSKIIMALCAALTMIALPALAEDRGPAAPEFIWHDIGGIAWRFHGNARIVGDELVCEADASAIRDCIAVFEELGWDWTYHAYREYQGWSVQLEPEGRGRGTKYCKSDDNPRRRAMLEGLSLNVGDGQSAPLSGNPVTREPQRLREKAAKRRKFTERMWTQAKEKLRKGWSFEMFSGRMRREGKVVVSAEAFYQEYYRRQKRVAEGKSDEELPPLPKAHRKRHKRGKSYKGAGRGKIPGRVDICERPKAVESRARGGHCEGDLINGLHGTGNLVTIAERMTRFTFFAYVASKDCRAVSETILQLLGSLPPGLLKTLTFDNGKEFAKFHVLVERLGLKVYFAKPYHSWERGTNENRNGIVRKVLPKGTPFDNLTREQMERIDHMLNDRPIKCLNWRTPREAFERLVKQALEEAVA